MLPVGSALVNWRLAPAGPSSPRGTMGVTVYYWQYAVLFCV